jgi:hypothetical protein
MSKESNCLAIDKTGAEKNHELEFEPPRPPRGSWEALSPLVDIEEAGALRCSPFDVNQSAFTFATTTSIYDLFAVLVANFLGYWLNKYPESDRAVREAPSQRFLAMLAADANRPRREPDLQIT